jgi:hypothetical protein
VRFVPFQEVERTQQMTDMGAKRNGKSRPEAARQLLATEPSRSRPSLLVDRTAGFRPKQSWRPRMLQP